MTKLPLTSQNGNVFIYLLIAIALFAGLTMVLTRTQTGSTDQNTFSEGQVNIAAQRLLNTASAASQVWLQMKNTGTNLTELDLVQPSSSVFNTGSSHQKMFHVDGGGMQYNDMNTDDFRASSTTPVGWYYTKVQADWTTSSAADFLMTYIRLKQSICAAINLRLTGSTTIPTVTTNFTNVFASGTSDLLESECAECKTYPSICVQNGGIYAFYNMIDAR
jgi:hypothetical protein